MKKVKTIADIKNDSRIELFIQDYDGKGRHMAECKDGYYFEDRATIAIGTVKEICYDIETHLMSVIEYDSIYSQLNKRH